MWTHKDVDLALHPVVGPLLQVGGAEKFPQALGFHVSEPLTKDLHLFEDLCLVDFV